MSTTASKRGSASKKRKKKAATAKKSSKKAASKKAAAKKKATKKTSSAKTTKKKAAKSTRSSKPTFAKKPTTERQIVAHEESATRNAAADRQTASNPDGDRHPVEQQASPTLTALPVDITPVHALRSSGTADPGPGFSWPSTFGEVAQADYDAALAVLEIDEPADTSDLEIVAAPPPKADPLMRVWQWLLELVGTRRAS